MTYDYQRFFEAKLGEIAKEGHIIDIGGGEPFQKEMARYKHLFEGKRYETIDNSPSYQASIQGDAEHLPFPDGSVSAILCKSVFEHLLNPTKAAEEIHRVLKKGGKMLLYTHFIYPYHARPGIYGDYFRFTEEALRHLFRGFTSIEVKKQGGYFRAMMFFLPLQRFLRPMLEPLAYLLDKIFRTELRKTTVGYYVYGVK